MSDQPVLSPLVISFNMSYAKGYPEIEWTQNRDPEFSELHIFLGQLAVKSFRISAMIANAENSMQNAAIQPPELVTSPNAGG